MPDQPMTNAELAELIRLRAEATELPWQPGDDFPGRTIWAGNGDIPVCDVSPHVLRDKVQGKKDEAYIVAACNAVPRLLPQVAWLEAEVARLRAALTSLYTATSTDSPAHTLHSHSIGGKFCSCADCHRARTFLETVTAARAALETTP